MIYWTNLDLRKCVKQLSDDLLVFNYTKLTQICHAIYISTCGTLEERQRFQDEQHSGVWIVKWGMASKKNFQWLKTFLQLSLDELKNRKVYNEDTKIDEASFMNTESVLPDAQFIPWHFDNKYRGIFYILHAVEEARTKSNCFDDYDIISIDMLKNIFTRIVKSPEQSVYVYECSSDEKYYTFMKCCLYLEKCGLVKTSFFSVDKKEVRLEDIDEDDEIIIKFECVDWHGYISYDG